MANMRSVAIALAVCLTWAGFVGLAASGTHVPHTVLGGVFGPGGSVAPTGNPANAANATFYSPSVPSYTVLQDPNLADADGVLPASFAMDVGVVWEWAAGDQIVVVAETVRGLNGHTGVNFTTSVDGVLSAGGPTQDLGDGLLEPLPVITLTSGADWVRAQWSGLLDANGNVVSYHVWTAGAPGGPWVSLATVNQAPTPSHNDTGLSTGQHCYTLGVNYRRDLAGGVYETTGRSEPQCATTAGASPTILVTNPASGATGVAVSAPVVVTFSEAINTATFAWTITGGVTLVPTWSGGDTVVTGNHVMDFTQCTLYTVQVTVARDVDGNNLVPGPVPNPWSFTTFCPSPYIVSTTPVDGAAAVNRGTSIVVTFSEPMNPATVIATVNPSPAGKTDAMSGGNTVLTVTHNGLTAGTMYTVTVSGQDVDGNPLVPGPVPNPFDFTANRPPTALLSAPGVGVCRTGGAALDITWTMSDPETATGSLRVWINFTDGVTTSPIPGAQGLQTLNSPETFAWPTPSGLDASVTILLEVRDGAGESAQSTSPSVTIDSTPPTVLMTRPAPGATGVATDTTIELTFSEAMATSTAEAAISIGGVTGLTFSWSGSTVVTIDHPVLATNQLFTVTVGTGARDACTPGLTLTTSYSASFTTGAGVRAPNPPTGLQETSATATAIVFRWTAPTLYNDGSPLPSSEIQGYRVWRALTETGTRTELTASGLVTGTTFTDSNVAAGREYWYWVQTVDTSGSTSGDSEPLQATAGTGAPEGFNWLVVLIPLVVVLLLVGVFLLMRRKKPAPAAPKGRAAPRAPPEGSKAEEVMEAEPAGETGAEGEEKFIPCPNCGTMVKPTDAECFVCGAKL